MKLQFPSLQPDGTPDEQIAHVVAVINDTLGNLQGRMLRVSECDFRTIVAPTTANTPFIVPHSLMGMPVFATALTDVDARIYATADDRREWSNTQIKIRCTSADSTLVVKVER